MKANAREKIDLVVYDNAARIVLSDADVSEYRKAGNVACGYDEQYDLTEIIALELAPLHVDTIEECCSIQQR